MTFSKVSFALAVHMTSSISPFSIQFVMPAYEPRPKASKTPGLSARSLTRFRPRRVRRAIVPRLRRVSTALVMFRSRPSSSNFGEVEVARCHYW